MAARGHRPARHGRRRRRLPPSAPGSPPAPIARSRAPGSAPPTARTARPSDRAGRAAPPTVPCRPPRTRTVARSVAPSRLRRPGAVRPEPQPCLTPIVARRAPADTRAPARGARALMSARPPARAADPCALLRTAPTRAARPRSTPAGRRGPRPRRTPAERRAPTSPDASPAASGRARSADVVPERAARRVLGRPRGPARGRPTRAPRAHSRATAGAALRYRPAGRSGPAGSGRAAASARHAPLGARRRVSVAARALRRRSRSIAYSTPGMSR